MSIKFVPGTGWVHDGDGGTPYVLGGELDRQRTQNYHQELAEFMSAHGYNPDQTYDYSSLFGSAPQGNYTPSFGQGPNSSWGHALQDRLAKRQSGMMSGVGHFENRLRTADRDYTGRIYDRNNAIEDMFRRGYSRKQISDYLAGKVDRDNFQPDWSDYRKMKREAIGATGGQDAAGLLSGEIELEPVDESFWGDDYFIGAPERTYAENPFGPSSNPNQAPNPFGPGSNNPNTKPATDKNDGVPFERVGLLGNGGFMGAYKKRREELDSKRSVMSLFKEMEDYQGE